MTKEELDQHIDNSHPIRVTRAAVQAVDLILADLKRRGRGRDFYTKEKTAEMRQEWITTVVRAVMDEIRD